MSITRQEAAMPRPSSALIKMDPFVLTRIDPGSAQVCVDMAGIALVDEARMSGDRGAAMEDLNLGGVFVNAERLAHEALGHRVPVGVHGDIAVQIDHAIEQLVDRWQCSGQALQVRLLASIPTIDVAGCIGGSTSRCV